jgi:rRNA small subunit pseudouridine methyltransferase Nep1
MAQLLTKLKIRAEGSSVTLMKIVKNPIIDHLPIGVRKIGTSTKGQMVRCNEYITKNCDPKKPYVFVIGCVSKGNPGMENDYVDECIAIS